MNRPLSIESLAYFQVNVSKYRRVIKIEHEKNQYKCIDVTNLKKMLKKHYYMERSVLLSSRSLRSFRIALHYIELTKILADEYSFGIARLDETSVLSLFKLTNPTYIMFHANEFGSLYSSKRFFEEFFPYSKSIIKLNLGDTIEFDRVPYLESSLQHLKLKSDLLDSFDLDKLNLKTLFVSLSDDLVCFHKVVNVKTNALWMDFKGYRGSFTDVRTGNVNTSTTDISVMFTSVNFENDIPKLFHIHKYFKALERSNWTLRLKPLKGIEVLMSLLTKNFATYNSELAKQNVDLKWKAIRLFETSVFATEWYNKLSLSFPLFSTSSENNEHVFSMKDTNLDLKIFFRLDEARISRIEQNKLRASNYRRGNAFRRRHPFTLNY